MLPEYNKYLFSVIVQKPGDLHPTVQSLMWISALYEILSVHISKPRKEHCYLLVISDDKFPTTLETVRKNDFLD